VAGGQERGVGQPAAGAGDRLAHGGQGQAQPVGVAEPGGSAATGHDRGRVAAPEEWSWAGEPANGILDDVRGHEVWAVELVDLGRDTGRA
jgi:hypothetical protein